MAREVQGDPYKGLANAVVIQAADDYRTALKRLKEKPGDQEAERMIWETEAFFHSAWYRELTAVEGDFLIGKLRREMDQ